MSIPAEKPNPAQDDPMKTGDKPGPVALFGSGETSPSGQKIFTEILKRLPHSPKVSILETPAGFELNSAQVARRVEEFLIHNLQNFSPRTNIVPARKRGTDHSPDDPGIAAGLLTADLIFMGPGSPTYAVRQLQESLVWNYLVARHRLGTGLALASAATVAISAYALPVYEIFKVGEDIHWKPGLDFFSPFGWNLVFVPHWNNREGGAELDTSRCFIGQERFDLLVEKLPESITIVGIDENTGLIFDFEEQACTVVGKGRVTVIHQGNEEAFSGARKFNMRILGDYQLPKTAAGIPEEIWETVISASRQRAVSEKPAEKVQILLKRREAARQRGDWREADELRKRIHALGWQVVDTREGTVVRKEE